MSKTVKEKNIALFGLGPHARRIYYPYLESLCKAQPGASIKLVVDLDSQQEKVDKYISTREVKPEATLFVSAAEQISPTAIDPKVANEIKRLGITHAIIATEPKSHKAYLEACITSDIAVLVDKPVTVPTGLLSNNKETAVEAIDQIEADVNSLIKLNEQHPKARVIVQSQRRNHEGYKIVFDELARVVSDHGVPITSITVSHSDGMWNMPDELFSRENHPYKYGYGKLMHSGYHFIDLLNQIEKINHVLHDKRANNITIFNQNVTPADHLKVIDGKDYQKLLQTNPLNKISSNEITKVDEFGELDSYVQLQYRRDQSVITTAQLSLIQTGYSRRAWPELPEDTYKGNGRVRHEHVNVHIGPLMNIQVHSYQAAENHDAGSDRNGVGGREHFDIYIFRNTDLIGGDAFEKIEFGTQHQEKHKKSPIYLGHNEQARHFAVDELINNLPSKSELKMHKAPIAVLSRLCYNQLLEQQGKVPYSILNIQESKGR